jgi:hypothetical protein
MPLPTKKDDESKDQFMDRCLSSEVSQKEFTDIKQRIAVCLSQWKKKDK